MSYAFPTGSTVKNTNFINESGIPTQLSENYIYNGNVYPIFETVLYLPALPNATTGNYPHNILNYPTSPQLILEIYGFSTNTSGFTMQMPQPEAGIVSLGINSTDVVILTSSNLSMWTGFVKIKYCQQTVFTPLTQF